MNPKVKALLVGGLGGAVLGALFAWIATDVDDSDGQVGITALGPGDYIGLGIAILTLARQFSGMVRK
jgi:hypothetical protein